MEADEAEKVGRRFFRPSRSSKWLAAAMAASQKTAAQPYDIEVVNPPAKHNLKSARGCAVCFVAVVLPFDLSLLGCMSASGFDSKSKNRV